ncbi:hypothetical protein FE257_003545 [Aspergillus nanangensis]|uniref:CBM6 domain-containing protein n=1 Tax=Aspergillus nanangensis TaxID=2582783 RepID=A0AAD4GPI6_ASPNN|nr:hypothetical protein FE257_003545 [Aspergillus nanangensis]
MPFSKSSLLYALLGITTLTNALNPIVQTVYTADPAPLVHNDRMYIFTGHDEDNSTSYNLTEWLVYSSSDMANWQHHRSPMALPTFDWADAQAWAGQVIARNDQFYFYVPVHHRDTQQMAIGVGVSDTITGPYKDAIGAPLLANDQIDPTVFIDTDGQAYLYWGNPDLWYVTLNPDMVSYSGNITQVPLTASGFDVRPDDDPSRPSMYEEAPWLYLRSGVYYLLWAADCCPEHIRYSTGPSATGPWTQRGVLMAAAGISSTNHPGIVDFRGGSYFVYHNSALPGGGSYTRSVAVESFVYNDDGTIPEMKMSVEGPAQVQDLDPFVRQEAETVAWAEGVEMEDCEEDEGGVDVTDINRGDYILVKGVGFGRGAAVFRARVASGAEGGSIELRLDGVDGVLVATCTVPGTGGWQSWRMVECPVSDEAIEVHDLFFVFTGAGEEVLFNFDWWQFVSVE